MHRALIASAAAALACAQQVVVTQIMNYYLGPDGSGPFPCASVLAAHAGTTPTAVVGQFLNEPMGVQAFNESGGAAAPVWSQWPESTSVDICWTADGSPAAVPQGAVDSVILQYSAMQFEKTPMPCVLQGMVTAGAAASATLAWTHTEDSCIPGGQASTDYLGYNHNILISADGATVVAALRLNCTSGCDSGDEILLGLDAPTGAVLYRTNMPGGTIGVAPSADGAWVLTATSVAGKGREAVVYGARSGLQRGAAGCAFQWSNSPTFSGDAQWIAAGDQNGMTVCQWEGSAYVHMADIAIPALGQQYWFPLSMAVINVTGADGEQHYIAGATFFANTPQAAESRAARLRLGGVGGTAAGASARAANDGSIGRFYAVDILAAVDQPEGSFIVIDHVDDTNRVNLAWGLTKTAGDYFVVGSMGGDGNATEPTLFLYSPGTPGAPALAPLWSAATAGYVLDMDALWLGNGTLQLLAAAGGENAQGEGGNGGNALWLQLAVTANASSA